MHFLLSSVAKILGLNPDTPWNQFRPKTLAVIHDADVFYPFYVWQLRASKILLILIGHEISVEL
jgi:hypothetical protein